MDITISTYGGGQILYQIFTALAKLSNKTGGILYPLLTISAIFGLFVAISRSFFSQSPENFFKKYFVPIFLTSYVILLPTTKVYIEDLIKQEGFSVSGVPYVLAKSASIISSVGYQITKAFELVLHTPNDKNYNSTGMIFGADTQLDARTFKIRNSDLEYNLRSICKNCVLYDLALNKYSFDDLKKSGDIWSFLESNTSKSRMINFYNLKSIHGQNGEDTYITCQKAMQILKPIFRNEIEYFSKQEIIKNLPLRYQALTGTQIDTDNIISQQIMFGVLKDGLKGSKFAESRAYTQQRSTYQIIGSLAGTSLVTMRAIFEALIYMSFIFVAPLTLMPGGYVFIKNWLFMAAWIQLWPPFYSILNFMMYIVSKERASSVLIGSTKTLCYIEQMGLDNFYEDVNAMAGYLMMSVPFISYAIIKGGVQSLMHMAGSLMSPAQSAATSAANEMSSGNYNYGNISYSNASLGNATKLQRNIAPLLNHGYYQENMGSHSEIYGNERILNQNSSNLRDAMVSEESISKSLNESYQNATSLSENTQKMYQESFSTHGRTCCDVIGTLGKSENYTSNISNSERNDIMSSARQCESLVKNISERFGVDENTACSYLISAGLNTVFLGGASVSDSQSAAINKFIGSDEGASMVKDFQSCYQKLQDFAETRAHNTLVEEGIRKSDAFTQSLDDVKSSSEQHALSLSQLSQISEQVSLYKNDSERFTKNLNQDFVDYASEKCGSFASASEKIRNGSSDEKDELYRDYFSYQISKFSMPKHENLRDNYSSINVTKLDKEKEESHLYRQSSELEKSTTMQRGYVHDMKNEISSDRDHFTNNSESTIKNTERNILNSSRTLEKKSEMKSNESLHKRALSSAFNRIKTTADDVNDTVKKYSVKTSVPSGCWDQKSPMWDMKEGE